MRRLCAVMACGLLFCLAALAAYAGPNQAELESYRILVADWSKTSGGHSPALSPDGRTLVYLSQGKVWVLSDLDQFSLSQNASRTAPRLPVAWQLDVKLPDTETKHISVTMTTYEAGGGPKDVDWSPNGKRVAFIYEGRLFIAEDLDHKNRSVRTRMLADVSVWTHDAQNREGRPLESPRWSPDGKKIAFVRPADTVSPVAWISTLDVASGTETVVARDAEDGPYTWGQPWSLDSKSLVYSCMRTDPDGRCGVRGGISIVRISEAEPSKLLDEVGTCSPSWSPDGERLAFLRRPDDKGISSGLLRTVVSDINGDNIRPVAAYVPSKAEKAAATTEMRERLQRVLRDQYPGVYTDEQLKRFAEEDVTDNEVICILMTASAVSEAKEIGGEFQQRIEDAMREYASGKNIESCARMPPCVAASEAVDSLPEGKERLVRDKLDAGVSDAVEPFYRLAGKIDNSPVWSPDGRRLAFARRDVTQGNTRLLSVDVETDEASVLFEENDISEYAWTSDGKAVVVVSARNLAYKSSDSGTGGLWPEFLTIPSFPEIWLIEPK